MPKYTIESDFYPMMRALSALASLSDDFPESGYPFGAILYFTEWIESELRSIEADHKENHDGDYLAEMQEHLDIELWLAYAGALEGHAENIRRILGAPFAERDDEHE